MKFKVKSWLDGKFGKKRREQRPVAERFDGLPVLPSERQCVVTPSPSQETLTLTTRSQFFEVIPRELRWKILALAFGDRTVHMDLSFVHPVAPRLAGDYPIVAHAGINANARTTHPPQVKWDLSVPKSWQWWGSVCHRKVPDHMKTPSDRIRAVEVEAGGDYCRVGAEHNCAAWPGEYPSKCKIGAMGWLLVCRQAYIEGIQVLYKTNTIHMSGPPLLSQNLPQLLLPQRLRDITSVEIALPLEFDPNTEHLAILENVQLNRVLAVLSEYLPNLARLHLGLKTKGHQYRRVDPDAFFAPLDAFARRHVPRLRQFTVSPSQSVWQQLYETARSQILTQSGMTIDQQQPVMPDQFRRNLDGSFVMVRIPPGDENVFRRMRSPYPNPPVGPSGPEAVSVGEGYWVVWGDEDADMRSVACNCLGS